MVYRKIQCNMYVGVRIKNSNTKNARTTNPKPLENQISKPLHFQIISISISINYKFTYVSRRFYKIFYFRNDCLKSM